MASSFNAWPVHHGNVTRFRVFHPDGSSPVEDQLADARQVAVALNELLRKKLGG
jgi:hypothetical protein